MVGGEQQGVSRRCGVTERNLFSDTHSGHLAGVNSTVTLLVAYSLGVDHRAVQMIPFIDLDRCRPLPITPDGTPNLGKCLP